MTSLVLKYNPYHDKAGRFASKDGASTLSGVVSLSHGTRSAEAIRKEGFKLNPGGDLVRTYGHGVYLTNDKSIAEKFGDVVEVKVKGKFKVLSDREFDEAFESKEFRAFRDKKLKDGAELPEGLPTDTPKAWVSEFFKSKGFSGLHFTRGTSYKDNSLFVLFDPGDLKISKAESQTLTLYWVPPETAVPKSKKSQPFSGGDMKLDLALKTDAADDEQRMVYSEVYAPNRPDVHGEFMRADTIRKMAHDFARELLLNKVDVEHDNQTVPEVQIVESFVARKGDPDFIEGSWVVGIHVNDDDTWDKVKKGELNGLSVEAWVHKEEQDVVMSLPPVVTGKTSKSEDHEHVFYVSFDDEGNFLGGITNEVDGHSHEIRTGTVTELVKDHSHRFCSIDGVEILP